uniref:DNA primase n=1 Tax=candidate division WOR-3 bacterium TaxID=2052148 RepID=A0A7V3RGA7_UNCW3
MIEREKIDEIIRQTDIVDLISQYIQLRKVGKNYRALCPFHTERTPSFYVSPEKGIYYCFGCKKGGNAVSFLMEYEHLDFPDALRRLAKNLGIEIDTTKNLKYKELYEVNELATQFFNLALNKEIGKKGQNYLKERMIDPEKLKDFRLGYAPTTGGLIPFMRQKGVGIERLIQAGLVSQNREIFHDRIIFPIFNLSGRVIGFGGRGIENYIQPKYLNSPETPIFKKGEILYGLFQAKESMRAKSEAILVEGYFDLLSLYQRNLKNICAPLGTALTENQALLISRYAKKVNILFDGDASGIKAALRAIGILLNTQVSVHVAMLPEGYDPDEFIKEKGSSAINDLINSAPDFFTFYKDIAVVKTVEDEINLINELVQIIGRIQDPVRLDRYLKYASRVFDIPVDVLRKKMGMETSYKKEAPPSRSSRTTTNPEEKLMTLIINNLEYFNRVKELLSIDDFKDAKIKTLFEILLKREDFAVQELVDLDIDEELKNRLLASLIETQKLDEEEFVRSINLFYKKNIMRHKLKQKISEAIKADDTESLKKYKELLKS